MTNRNIDLKVSLSKAVVEAVKIRSLRDYGTEDVSLFFNWLVRKHCPKEIEKIEKELERLERKENSCEKVKPKVLTYTERDAEGITKCEICGLPIDKNAKICKGIYSDGTETNYFVHKTCCED